jgi:signal transduction histidine kinase
VKRLSFRTRLFLYLLLFAIVPASVLMLGGTLAASRAVSLVGGSQPWERVAESGRRALSQARQAPLTAEQRAALEAHEQELRGSLLQASRFSYLAERVVPVIALFALVGIAILALLASRVAGHLSRQMSRPLNEIVGWTDLIGQGKPLPEGTPRKRGAPEFDTLRRRMRRMARELTSARSREREAERVEAFRETARRVAHELKNPLTPIRFAIARLKRDVPPPLREPVEVLEVESARLEEMARSFSQFGRLPEGPPADVDMAELARYTARSMAAERVPLRIEIADPLPMIRGHHDALARALSNVLINAVEACRDSGEVDVRLSATRVDGGDAVEVIVRDTGCGIPADQLARIWEPYVTSKVGGTGLGLAIARQTVLAHGGAVDAASVEGKGTEIRFVIPVNGAAPAPLTAAETPSLAEQPTSTAPQY